MNSHQITQASNDPNLTIAYVISHPNAAYQILKNAYEDGDEFSISADNSDEYKVIPNFNGEDDKLEFFYIVKLLGSGTYANTYDVIGTLTKTEFTKKKELALKVFNHCDEKMSLILKEIEILSDAKEAYDCKQVIVSTILDKKQINTIGLEIRKFFGKELQDFINEDNLTTAERFSLAIALWKKHKIQVKQYGIVNLDIKPANIIANPRYDVVAYDITTNDNAKNIQEIDFNSISEKYAGHPHVLVKNNSEYFIYSETTNKLISLDEKIISKLFPSNHPQERLLNSEDIDSQIYEEIAIKAGDEIIDVNYIDYNLAARKGDILTLPPHSYRGSMDYVAPEVVNGQSSSTDYVVNKSSDRFSIAICISNIFNSEENKKTSLLRNIDNIDNIDEAASTLDKYYRTQQYPDINLSTAPADLPESTRERLSKLLGKMLSTEHTKDKKQRGRYKDNLEELQNIRDEYLQHKKEQDEIHTNMMAELAGLSADWLQPDTEFQQPEEQVVPDSTNNQTQTEVDNIDQALSNETSGLIEISDYIKTLLAIKELDENGLKDVSEELIDTAIGSNEEIPDAIKQCLAIEELIDKAIDSNGLKDVSKKLIDIAVDSSEEISDAIKQCLAIEEKVNAAIKDYKQSTNSWASKHFFHSSKRTNDITNIQNLMKESNTPEDMEEKIKEYLTNRDKFKCGLLLGRSLLRDKILEALDVVPINQKNAKIVMDLRLRR